LLPALHLWLRQPKEVNDPEMDSTNFGGVIVQERNDPVFKPVSILISSFTSRSTPAR
jgi:hypothetical protein